MNYFWGDFIKDVLPILPLQYISLRNNRASLFYLIKLLRLAKGFHILNVTKFMKKIKAVYKARTELLLKNDPVMARTDIDNDHNKIGQQLNIFYTLKITKVIIVILNFAYLLGMFWYILMRLVEDFDGEDYSILEESGEDGMPFIAYYGIQNQSDGFITVTMIYYAFTSLSTVGFGDYAPRSDLERAIGSMVLLCGVAVFSYIMGNFIDILNNYLEFTSDINDGDKLSRFFGILKEFNKGKDMDSWLKLKMESFFDYKWQNDKQLPFYEESDEAMLE